MRLSLLVAGFSAISSIACAQRDFSAVEITTEKAAEGIYMLQGAGGNIGLSVGADGAFVIDDQFAPLSEKIMAAIAEVTDKPVSFVLNTHHHGDHTGGNEQFGKSGAHIVAHDNVRTRLEVAGDAASKSLPVITFSDTTTFHWNGDTIFIFHPENAHTDGDSIVHFQKANVIHMGDVFFAGRYPFIDVKSGGNLNGYIAALETALARINDETVVIPGHGPISRKADLMKSIALLKDIRTRVQALIDDGLDENAAVAADPLSDLNDEWAWGFISGERMTRAAYQSLK